MHYEAHVKIEIVLFDLSTPIFVKEMSVAGFQDLFRSFGLLLIYTGRLQFGKLIAMAERLLCSNCAQPGFEPQPLTEFPC